MHRPPPVVTTGVSSRKSARMPFCSRSNYLGRLFRDPPSSASSSQCALGAHRRFQFIHRLGCRFGSGPGVEFRYPMMATAAVGRSAGAPDRPPSTSLLRSAGAATTAAPMPWLLLVYLLAFGLEVRCLLLCARRGAHHQPLQPSPPPPPMTRQRPPPAARPPCTRWRCWAPACTL